MIGSVNRPIPSTQRAVCCRVTGARGRFRHAHRGLTLIELLIGLTITALIGAAIASMMATVSRGVVTRRDARSFMLRSHAAHIHLGLCIDSARAILDATDAMVVIWYDDNRRSGTVHASEMCWIEFQSAQSRIVMHRVQFPSEWSNARRSAEDWEYPASTTWSTVLARYQTMGWISTRTIVEDVTDMAVELNAITPVDATVISFDIEFTQDGVPQTARLTHALRFHEEPA